MTECPECKGKGSIYVSLVGKHLQCPVCKGTKFVKGYQPESTATMKNLREKIEQIISTGMYDDTAPSVLTEDILIEVNSYLRQKDGPFFEVKPPEGS